MIQIDALRRVWHDGGFDKRTQCMVSLRRAWWCGWRTNTWICPYRSCVYGGNIRIYKLKYSIASLQNGVLIQGVALISRRFGWRMTMNTFMPSPLWIRRYGSSRRRLLCRHGWLAIRLLLMKTARIAHSLMPWYSKVFRAKKLFWLTRANHWRRWARYDMPLRRPLASTRGCT